MLVAVLDGVCVLLAVFVGVGVGVTLLGVFVGVGVGVTLLGVLEGVFDGVLVFVGVGVKVGHP